jgi:hypothetical protein
MEFAVPGWLPTHTLEGCAHRVWLYQAPFKRA